ncbi:hypothetical protein [Amycolatopsis plumensis]|uniref:Uncharacterized protein n=1 Tax=Amycolatopsis plumensis TaxID=236508 RepID=A0ABV5UG78_9PSEU
MDSADDYRSYADRVVVSIRFASMPVDEYVEVVVEIEAPGAAWHRDWLVGEFESVPQRQELPYVIKVQEDRHEWGASAAVFTVILYLGGAAASGVVGNAAYDALKAVAKDMAGRLRAADTGSAAPLTESEAIERSKVLISARFDEPLGGLELISSEMRFPDHASVSFQGESWHYDCDLALEDGLVSFNRVARRRR